MAMLLSACASSGGAGSVDRLGTAAPSVAVMTPVTPSGGSSNVGIAPSDGPEGAAARSALRTYQDWWQAQVEAFGRVDSDGSALEAYSSGQALSGVLVDLQGLRAAKLVMIGGPRNSPVVKTLDLKANPQTAVVEDCLDVTGWHQADAGTHATKDPVQRLSRYIATASLRKSEARWLIYDFKREVGRTC
ncbi:hypothetical protein ACFVVX_16625 [Kitasatospora sp. NPDC058170]|uniref:hypothetical protein n=1 Tax=Kitasatospora sp. NPDC058170 TaxID=3346364 RepID=UPI0036DB51B7